MSKDYALTTGAELPDDAENILTVSPDQATQGDYPDYPDSEACPQLTNQEFLSALFDHYDGLVGRPNVISLQKITKTSNWGGHRWRRDSDYSAAGLNWYFTLAVYRDDTTTKRKTDCLAICGLMLDDLSTKALPLSRLDACPPTYVIETSSGNHQAGYLFDTPQTDFKLMESINTAMIAAQLCDPGATGPTSRIGRLPVASNTKYTPVFQCRLVSFNPERRYTPEQLIEGLELQPPKPKGRPKVDKAAKAAAIDSRTEDVYVARSAENAVLTALKAKGLYKRPLGGGRHDITCPWAHEHTDMVDHGTAYFEPDDLYPAGGFKCQHSHGEQKKLGALLAYLEVSFRAAKHKPTIRISAGESHRIADAAEKELADSGRYYQTGGAITSVVTDPASGATSIKPMKLNALLRAMSQVAVWERFDQRSDGWVPADPTQRHGGMLVDAERYNHLPALVGQARQPFLRPDGSVVRTSGFDPLSGYFGTFDSNEFNIPDRPTLAQAQAALNEINALLNEFAFASPNDRAAALAGILTAAARPSLELAPMFHVRAPIQGSGKSFLTSLIAAFVSPAQVPSNALPGDGEELRKMLMAELMASPPAIVFDNLVTDLLPYPKLCSALTEEFITDRILGISKQVTVSTRVLFLSSGNNVGPVKDMPRRTVTINLDPQVENPITRNFSGNPLAEVRRRRGHYASLALTIIRGWLVNGRPYTDCKPYGSYGQWCDWIRQPLLWLGVPDPVAKVFESMETDPDRETLGRLMTAWRAAFGREATMVRTAVYHALYNSPELKEICMEVAEHRGEINQQRLSRWIARHELRIVDGMRFERSTLTRNSVQWCIKDVQNSRPESGQSGKSGCSSQQTLTVKNSLEADYVESEETAEV